MLVDSLKHKNMSEKKTYLCNINVILDGKQSADTKGFSFISSSAPKLIAEAWRKTGFVCVCVCKHMDKCVCVWDS